MGIPHSAKTNSDFSELLGDLGTFVDESIKAAANDSDLKGLFRLSTALHSSLNGFLIRDESRLLNAAAGIARRVTVLAVLHQVSLAKVELRRLIECTLWYVYFHEHPVEFEAFLREPSRSWDEKRDRPISSAASSPMSFYAAYAKERFENEPSGLGLRAVEVLRQEYGNLSGHVHAALGAMSDKGNLALPHDQWTKPVAGSLKDVVQQVFRSSIIAISASNPDLLGGLDAIPRSWFDWLVSEDAKAIRGSPFGIKST